ncbi:putative multidrug resistance-associated protein 1 [Blattamonas nauphoetae]|uniref:Multidrug resistance-associated protein 1 n=1 Tax=Blattamonas nauphoetae TaxID=2049346 RepID=A0ABQ9Y8D1_9EUKA|nr:putative multidrug resistance-associated protein 1 [Blattamonas nauphoetae]
MPQQISIHRGECRIRADGCLEPAVPSFPTAQCVLPKAVLDLELNWMMGIAARARKDIPSVHQFGPVSFFDTAPLGRVINRFGGDIAQTDMNLIIQHFIGQILIIAISTPLFLAIGLPVLVLFGIVLVLYSRAARDLQRLDSVSCSPVISIFSEVINGAGLSTIRSFHQEDRWKRRFEEKVDDWTVRTPLNWEGKAWGTAYNAPIVTINVAGVMVIGWFFMTAPQLSVALTSSLNFNTLGINLVM